jgi:ArsR family transcriptional regulator, arsenate/arsenite/antimonite-responsive transcriptional repressor
MSNNCSRKRQNQPSFLTTNGYLAILPYTNKLKGTAMGHDEQPDRPEALGKKFYKYIQKIIDDRELYKLKARVAKALAHESRLMIIDALYEKDMCVSELTEMVGTDQSTVSKHLSVLKQAGIIMDRKEASNKVYYHLRVALIRQFSELAMTVIQGNIPRGGFHALRGDKPLRKR